MAKDRANDPNRVPPAVAWQSPWPVGHPNRTEYVSPEQQTANMRGPKKTEYYTDYDKKSGTIMKKSDLQARDGWVSPWPVGHPNYTEMVK
jgi:hypothetical protein